MGMRIPLDTCGLRHVGLFDHHLETGEGGLEGLGEVAWV
jgi:hypothetical protein